MAPPAPPARRRRARRRPRAGAVAPSTPSAPPKISLRKRALAKVVQAGSTVRYQLVVKATGGTAHDVVVCDKLPDHMTYVSLGTATLQDGKACWASATSPARSRCRCGHGSTSTPPAAR